MKFFALISLLVLSSCFTPDKQSEADQLAVTGSNNASNSAFRVVRVMGNNVNTSFIGGWGLAERMVYEYKACLVSRQNRNIRNRQFIIKDGDRKIAEPWTDPASGCLIWYEPMDFDVLAKPYYLEVKRNIVGTREYAGNVEVRLAVNPWATTRNGNVKEVFDLNFIQNQNLVFENQILKPKKQIQEALLGNMNLRDGFPRVFVEDIRFGAHVNNYTTVDGIDGASMNINVEMRPQFAVESFDEDNLDFMNLKQGRFHVELYLVARVQRKDEIIRHVLKEFKIGEPINVVNGKLNLNFDDVFHLLSYEGQLELGLRLTPADNMSRVAPFQGLFLLGKYNRRTGFQNATLQRGINQSYGLTNTNLNNLFSGRNLLQELKEGEYDVIDGIRILRPFIYSMADFRFVSIENDTPLRRTISYRVKTCLKEEIDRASVQWQVFEVELPDGRKIHPPLDDDSCLKWSDTLTHDYYTPERLFERIYKIKHVDSGYQSEIIGILNPWDPGWTFGREAREISPGADNPTKVFSKAQKDKYRDYVQYINNRPTENSELFIAAYGYETIGFNYEIDEFMSLYVKKKLLMRAQIYVKRYNSLTHGLRAVEPLRDGIYLLRVAIHKKYYDPTYCVDIVPKEKPDYVTIPEYHGFEETEEAFYGEAKLSNRCDPNSNEAKKTFVDVVKKLVKVEYGRIITPIELTVRNLSLKRIRAQLLLQIEPIDLDKVKLVDMMIKNGKVDTDSNLAKTYNFAANRVDLSTLNRYIKDKRIDFNALTEKHNSITAAWNEIKEGVAREKFKDEERTLLTLDNIAVARERQQLITLVDQQNDQERNGSPDHNDEKLTLERFNEGAPFKIDEAYLAPILKKHPSVELNSQDDVDEVIWHGDTAHNKGLVSRTFVGPIRLLSPRFGPPVRATDGIDGDIYYEKGDGHTGSSDDLANVMIKDLEVLQKETERKYQLEKKYESLLFNYTDRFNLDFVSLGYREEKLKSITVDTKERLLNECDLENFERDCLVTAKRNNLGYNKLMRYLRFNNLNTLATKGFGFNEVQQIQDFIDEGPIESINRRGVKTIDQDFDKFGRQDLKNLIRKGETSRSLAYRMCYFFTFHNYNEMVKGKWGPYQKPGNSRRSKPVPLNEANRQDLINVFKDCAKKASKNFTDIFRINRQFRVHEIDQDDTRFVTGKSLNMNVGSNFGFSKSHSLDTGISAGGSPTKFLDSALRGLDKWIPGASFVSGLVSSLINVDFRSSAGYRDAAGTGTSISTGVYLVVQRATFDIFFKKFELCSSIRMRPEYIDDTIYPRIFKNIENDHYKAAATRGLFICNGDYQSSGNVASREYFYYFAQHFTAGDMLDDQDLRNHPWLLLLRGERDYLNFIERIKAYRPEDKELAEDPIKLANLYKPIAKMGLGDATYFDNNPANGISLGAFPIDQLIDAYKNVLPTFPGIYNLRPNKEEYPPYPDTRN